MQKLEEEAKELKSRLRVGWESAESRLRVGWESAESRLRKILSWVERFSSILWGVDSLSIFGGMVLQKSMHQDTQLGKGRPTNLWETQASHWDECWNEFKSFSLLAAETINIFIFTSCTCWISDNCLALVRPWLLSKFWSQNWYFFVCGNC